MKTIINLYINLVKYTPLKGNSYIPLPDELHSKYAIINMKNLIDQECFRWSVTRALNPVNTNANIITKELQLQSTMLNWNGIVFPVTLKKIDLFEKLNNEISIHVSGYEHKVLYPLRISKFDKPTQIDLLLISQGSNSHYCLIKNLSRLV